MTKITVAHVVEATSAGVGKHVADIVSAMNLERFDVHVVYSDVRMDRAFEEFIARESARGVRFRLVPMRRNISPVGDVVALLRLCRYFKRWHFDVVHTHSSKAGFLGRMAGWIAGVPVRLYTPNAFAFLGMKHGLKRRLYLALEQAAGVVTTRLIAVSQSEKSHAEAVLPASRGVLIPNAINIERPMGGRVSRADLGITGSHKVAIMVGRLSQQKNPLQFIEAAAHVAKQIPNVTFVIVGDGELRSECAHRIEQLGLSKRVRLLGYRADAPDLMALSDVFVMPSIYEGLPYVLLEAMAAGLPVVCNCFPGSEDLVIVEETALANDIGDARTMAYNLMRVLSDDKLATRLADNARALVRRHHSLDDMISHLESLYISLSKRG